MDTVQSKLIRGPKSDRLEAGLGPLPELQIADGFFLDFPKSMMMRRDVIWIRVAKSDLLWLLFSHRHQAPPTSAFQVGSVDETHSGNSGVTRITK